MAQRRFGFMRPAKAWDSKSEGAIRVSVGTGRLVVSHPFAKKEANGWGTQMVRGQIQAAGNPAPANLGSPICTRQSGHADLGALYRVAQCPEICGAGAA